MAIITTTEYKNHALITVSTYDTPIANFVAGIEAKVLRYLSRDSFNSATYNPERIDTDNGSVVWVRNWPITTLTSVSVYTDDHSSSTALATTDYVYDPASGRIDLTGWGYGRGMLDGDGLPGVPGWGFGPRHRRGIRRVGVVYTGGYSSPPDDLKLAMYEMVDTAYAARGRDRSLTSETLGEYSWTAKQEREMNDAMKRLFAPWKEPV